MTRNIIKVCLQRDVDVCFPHHRLVILSLGLLNAGLLIAAVVIGIYCNFYASGAKAQDLQVPDSAPIIIEINYLRNHSSIIRAKLEAQVALAKERTNHVGLKQQVKQQIALTDTLQGQIETLNEKRTYLQSNKTALEANCGRCPAGWTLLKSTCYFFSCHVTEDKKNWQDSRADCISRGGDLVVINNLAEQQLLSDNFPKQSRGSVWWQNGFWIGLTDVVTEGIWVWINNVTEVETMYWRNGQPNHEGPQSGNCAAFFHYGDPTKVWYNGNCQEHLYNWMCEMPPSMSLSVVRPDFSHYKQLIIGLTVLAVILLAADIGLGIYYNNLTSGNLAIMDIGKEVTKLQDSYNAAIQSRDEAKKQLAKEISEQQHTKWELEHQKRRSKDYERQTDRIKMEIATLESHMPMISENLGWLQTLSTRMDFHELYVLLLRFLRISFEEIMAGSQAVLHKTRRRLGSDRQQRETRFTDNGVKSKEPPASRDTVGKNTLWIRGTKGKWPEKCK
ncbi:hypothetical protein L3Q82_026606 [Scortum barcoo]|uniref:Uncharacterized protein n=1 Tax=Scortum barcoo TaxID=214431 RepID=A0ACB8WI75_9TELE|nr:hypothetical protein L3Q82_026606 [Scortum barcoo]